MATMDLIVMPLRHIDHIPGSSNNYCWCHGIDCCPQLKFDHSRSTIEYPETMCRMCASGSDPLTVVLNNKEESISEVGITELSKMLLRRCPMVSFF